MNLRLIPFNFSFSLTILLIFSVLYAFGDEAIVQTKYGPVRGNVFPTYRNFQGVPFATPPLGKLRWKYPIPPSPWTDVKDCTNFTIGCAQTAHSMDVPKNVSEDCLYLELWTPRVGKFQKPAAVMVWYYGGDFKEGGESFALYNGATLAATTNTIVIATNYRIGVMGFLYTSETDKNVGLEDQRFTLKWVQENIAAFGGDPKCVTIFGQSAGGESVLLHMSAPKYYSASMFHRAIVQSGPMALNFKDQDAADLLGRIFAFHLGCSYSDLACMQNMTLADILTAAGKSFIVPLDTSEAIMIWCPVVMGDASFPQQPLDAFERKQIVKVPFMIGSDASDGVLFGYAISPQYMAEYEYIAIVVGIFQIDAYTVLDAYPPCYGCDNRNICSAMITDYLFMCCSRITARWAEAAGISNTYYYQFSRQPEFCPWPDNQKFCCGLPCHGTEIAFVFNDTGNPYPWNFTRVDSYLAGAMTNYWGSFAHYGDPNKFNNNNVPTWPIYQTASDLNIQFNDTIFIQSNLNKKMCDMFDSLGYWHSPREIMVRLRHKFGKYKNKV